MRRGSLLVLCSALAALAPSRATAFEAVVLPAGALGADGTREHTLQLFLVEGEALLTAFPTVKAARGAILEPPREAPDGGVLVRYRPPAVSAPASDTLSVSLRGASAKVTVPLEPAGRASLTIAVSPTPLLVEPGASAEVRITVRDPAGRPARAPLRLGASVGKISAPVESAPGDYRATFTPPDEKFPQVAILAVLSVADGAFAVATCPLAARVTLNGEGEPGARMEVTVDGRGFGPVEVPSSGRFALPLVVPPGGRAVGTSTDRMGNVTKREIDLQLPPFPRVLIAAVPPELPADGRARAQVVAFAVDARGRPEKRGPPPLHADRGTLAHEAPRSDGAALFSLTAPSSVAGGHVLLKAGTAQLKLPLHPAPPFSLEVTPPTEPLAAGSDAPLPVDVRIRDRGGAPVAGATVEARLTGGRVLGVEEVADAPGRYRVRVVPPRDPGRGTASLHVEVTGVRAGTPRRLTLHPARASAGQVAVEAWVDDDLGAPVPGVPVEIDAPGGPARLTTDRFGTARLERARPPARNFRITAQLPLLPGVTATLDHLAVGGRWFAVSALVGHGVVPTVEPPTPSSIDAQLPLRPAAPVDVRLFVEPATRGAPVRLRVQLLDASGKPAPGPLLYQASGGSLEVVRPLKGGAAELRFIAPRPGRYLVSVTDQKSRVTAFAEVVAP
jgi:hypothetical protein